MLRSLTPSAVHVRSEFLVQHVVLLVWPGATYDVPFFVPMQHWADGASRRTIVTATVAPLEDSVEPQVFVNGTSAPGPWGEHALCDITQKLLPGRNVLSLSNPGNDVSLSVSICIEVRREVEFTRFSASIPNDANDFCLDALSFGGSSLTDLAEVRVQPSTMCPISRMEIVCGVRGRNCKHPQGFDAAAFISLCAMSGKWQCPLCGSAVFLEDLVALKSRNSNSRHQ